MSGGIRTSVKSHLFSQRITIGSVTNTIQENGITNGSFTAPLAANTEEEARVESDSTTSYRVTGFSGCLQILSFASQSRCLDGTTIGAESLPYIVPSTPQTGVEILLKIFSFKELKTAIRNFRPNSVIGEGGFGRVYKGWISRKSLAASKLGRGMAVAIKRHHQVSMQGWEEWSKEVYCLGQFRHPNLVKLIGYSSEDNELLLVYEFVPHGSLDFHIFRSSKSKGKPLSWYVRMKIALGAAKALAFLHNECQVIYRDFKSSNILLDSTNNVKLSDFGLAVDARSIKSPNAKTDAMGTYELSAPDYIETRVMGTFGYSAPEYIVSGHLTTKCDVYSFGVVMLELLSGKRALDANRRRGEIDLVELAKPYLVKNQGVIQLLDSGMKGQFSVASALKAADIALRCVSTDPKHRPEMINVVESLERLQQSSDMGDLRISTCHNAQASSSNGSKTL